MHHLLAERHHMTVAGVLPVAQTARSINAVSLQADESVGCAGLNIPDYDAPTQLVKPWERNSRYVDVVMTIPKVQPLRQSCQAAMLCTLARYGNIPGLPSEAVVAASVPHVCHALQTSVPGLPAARMLVPLLGVCSCGGPPCKHRPFRHVADTVCCARGPCSPCAA